MDLARYAGLRYVHSRDRGNLDVYVEASRAAAAAASPEDLAEASANLANALLAKAELTGSWAYLDESIKLLRHAVAVAGRRHPRRAELLRALSNALWLARG